MATRGTLVDSIRWHEPPVPATVAHAEPVTRSPSQVEALHHDVLAAAHELDQALAMATRLERLVPIGHHVADTRVAFLPHQIRVVVSFDADDDPEQLAMSERAEVRVEHPAGGVDVPVERPAPAASPLRIVPPMPPDVASDTDERVNIAPGLYLDGGLAVHPDGPDVTIDLATGVVAHDGEPKLVLDAHGNVIGTYDGDEFVLHDELGPERA